MARRRGSAKSSQTRQLTLPMEGRKQLARHRASVQSSLDDWLADRGEFDPSLEGSASRALTEAE
ncbi:MAG TPA: hypothetical protein VFY93_02775, partial [Planctomycetota bacterium]|nr:hypothetical protein [Planctomycetota bacterium]